MRSIQFKVVKQTSIEDCGPTCLYMLLKYYGGYEKLETIKKLCKTDKEGTTLYDLKEAAIALGFQTDSYHASVDDLQKNIHFPFIAHVFIDQKYYHYIIVYKIKKNHILVADPKEGRLLKMSISRFEAIYLNSILLLYPMHIEKRKSEKIGKWFFKIVKSFKKELFHITLYSFTIFFLEMLCVSSFYFLLMISKKQNIHLLQISIVFLFLFSILKVFLNYIRKKRMIRCNEEIYTSLKQKFYDWVYTLPYHEVKRKNSMELLLKLEQLESIMDYFFDILFFIFFEGLPFLGIIVFLFFQKSVIVYFILYLSIHFLVHIYAGRQQRILLLDLKEEMSLARRNEMEALSSVSTIDEMQIESIFIKRQARYTKSYLERRTKKNISYLRYETLLDGIKSGSDILLKGIFFGLLIHQKISLEGLLVLFYLFEKMNEFILGLSNLYIQKEEMKWALENMNIEKQEKKTVTVNQLSLKNVIYPYYGKIRNVSLDLKKKFPVLLLGESGIGKSTLAHIILGDYQSDGRFVNGEETSTRVNGCYVSGEAMIYTTTIMENILLGRTIEEKKLEEILKVTHVDKIIEKHKYLPLLERGENLSSGEKQKIVLARALIEDFDLLVLDEALNRLDQGEEIDIMESLLKMYSDKIIVVISHRYNLMDLFERIYMFTPHGQLKKWKGRGNNVQKNFEKHYQSYHYVNFLGGMYYGHD